VKIQFNTISYNTISSIDKYHYLWCISRVLGFFKKDKFNRDTCDVYFFGLVNQNRRRKMKEMKERLVEFFLRVFGFFLLFGTLFLMCFSLYHLNDKESIRSSSSGVALIPPTAEEQVERLRVQNRLERWDIREEVFDSLISDAVTCPSNLSLSMRIRFGEGDNGVALTFDRHIAVIKRVFQVQNFFDGEITSPVLVRGNDSHKPTIEWICVNMSAFFSEKRGPG